MAEEDQFNTLDEIAERLRVSDRTVRRWIESGSLHAYKPGGEWRVRTSDLDTFLEARSSPKAQALPSPPEVSDEERRGQIITNFLSYEEPFGELPADERIKRLKRWREHFERLGDRRSLDREDVVKRGVAAYARGMEMSALDEVDRRRYFAEGVHTHVERAAKGELKVSEEERGLCMRVNAAIANAQNLTNEVRELVQETPDRLERDMQRDAERFLREELKSGTRYE